MHMCLGVSTDSLRGIWQGAFKLQTQKALGENRRGHCGGGAWSQSRWGCESLASINFKLPQSVTLLLGFVLEKAGSGLILLKLTQSVTLFFRTCCF